MKRLIATTLAALIGFETFGLPHAQAASLPSPLLKTPVSMPSASLHLAFSLPSTVGDIVETHVGTNGNRLIYHIQDVHNHVPAQTNLSDMISRLERFAADQGKILVVAVEGVTGDVDSDTVSALTDQHAKEAVGAGLLRAGFLFGEEYAAITHAPGRIKLVGVESPALYKRNTDARWHSMASRRKVLATVHQIRTQLESLREHNFNPTLLALEKQRVAVDGGALSLVDYLKSLQRTRPTFVTKYPDVQKILDAASRESAIDFSKVELETRALISDITARASKTDIEKLMNDARAFKNGQITAAAYYGGLLARSSKNCPSIAAYVAYLKAASEIDADRVFDQVSALEQLIAADFLKNSISKQLYDHLRWAERQEKLFALTMVPQEWAQEKNANLNELYGRHQAIHAFVDEQNRDLGYTFSIPAFSYSDLNAAYKGAHTFYTAADARSTVMINNLESVLSRFPADKAVVAYIAGGFHTPGVTHLMRQRGLGYAVIRPKLETEIKLDTKYNFPWFRKEREITFDNKSKNFDREPGGLSMAGGQEVSGMISNPSQASGVLKTLGLKGWENGPLKITSWATMIALFGATTWDDFISYFSQKNVLVAVISVLIVYPILFTIRYIFKRFSPSEEDLARAESVTFDENDKEPDVDINPAGLTREQMMVTKSNLMLARMEKEGRLDQSTLADAQDYAYSRGLKLVVVSVVPGEQKIVAEREGVLFLAAQYLKPGRGAEIRRAIKTAIPSYLEPTMDHRAVFTAQNEARDRYYIDILEKMMNDQKFQQKVFLTYPDIFRYTKNGEEGNYPLDSLPSLMAQSYKKGWDESLPLAERALHTNRLKQVVDLASAVPDVLDPLLPETQKPRPLILPSIEELFSQEYTPVEGVNETHRSDNQSYSAFPVDGQGKPLNAGHLRAEIKDAYEHVDGAIYSGTIVKRVFTGGNARRLGAAVAALLTPEATIEKMKELGSWKGDMSVAEFLKLPVLTRIYLQDIALSIELAQKHHWNIEGAIANKIIVVPTNSENSTPIMNMVRQANFFGLPAHNVIFVEQESSPGVGFDGQGRMNSNFAEKSKAPHGAQGHGDAEHRHTLPQAFFTLDHDGRRYYRNAPLHGYLASQGKIIYHHQISLNDALKPEFMHDLRPVALMLAGAKLGMLTAQFRRDRSGLKGGVGVNFDEYPIELKEKLRLVGKKGPAHIESSTLNTPYGGEIKKSLAASVTNMAITGYPPKLVQNNGYFPFIATVRGVDVEMNDPKGGAKKVKVTVNPTIHWDLWSYGLFNNVPTIAYVAQADRAGAETKTPDTLHYFVETSAAQDSAQNNPVYYELAKKTNELLNSSAASAAYMGYGGHIVFMLLIETLIFSSFYYSDSFGWPAIPILAFFFMLLLLPILPLVRADGATFEDDDLVNYAIRHAEAIGFSKSAVVFTNLDSEGFGNIRLQDGKPVVEIEEVLVNDTWEYQTIFPKLMIELTLAHERMHLIIPGSFSNNRLIRFLNELIVYPLGFLAFVLFFFTSRIGSHSQPKSDNKDIEATFVARVVPALANDKLVARRELSDGIVQATAEKSKSNVSVPQIVLVDVASFYQLGQSPKEFAELVSIALHQSYPELTRLNASAESKAKIIFYTTSGSPYLKDLADQLTKGVLGFESEFHEVNDRGADITALLRSVGQAAAMADKTFLIRSNSVTHTGERVVGVDNLAVLPLAIHAYGRFGQGGRELLAQLLTLLQKFDKDAQSLDTKIQSQVLSDLAA